MEHNVKRQWLSPKELIVANGGVLPLSLAAVYQAIRRGEIPSQRIGKRILIPASFLDEFAKG